MLTNQVETKGTTFIGNASEVAPRIPMKPSTLLRLGRKRKVPSLILGHRTVLFDEAKVRAALNKFEVKEVA